MRTKTVNHVQIMRAARCWLACLLLGIAGMMSAAELAPSTAKSVREILEVGFEPGRESLPKAKTIHDSVVKSGDKSPKIAYAYGLVLLKQFKPKEAVEQFRLAAEYPDAPY